MPKLFSRRTRKSFYRSGSIYDEVGEGEYVGVKYSLKAKEAIIPLNKRQVRKLIEHGLIFSNLGWAAGTSGNLSFRCKDGFAITAAGINLGHLIEEDLIKVVKVDYNTDPPTVHYEKSINKERKPSSEVLAHHEIYKARPDVKVILHGHDKLTTEMARVIFNHAPDLIGRTSEVHPYCTKDFAFALRDIIDLEKIYLISQGHGFFSLGRDFKESLFYARGAHRAGFFLHRYVLIRASDFVVSKIPLFLEGLARSLTDRLEWVVKLMVKMGGPRFMRGMSRKRLNKK